MTKYVSTCPECGQRWHAWAERDPCDCPECAARWIWRGNTFADAAMLGIMRKPGTLTFKPEETLDTRN
jgi:DNA-directed RNA polymerase subunit RPC12/RpoP